MRMHIELDDELVARMDAITGPRGRSAFVRSALERALREEIRWSELRAAAGALQEDHEWDEDAALWVRQQRQADDRRAG